MGVLVASLMEKLQSVVGTQNALQEGVLLAEHKKSQMKSYEVWEH